MPWLRIISITMRKKKPNFGNYFFFHARRRGSIILTRQYYCIGAIVPSCINILEVIMITTQPSVKVIGANGQISLGKQYAGRQVLVEEQEPGVWLVRTATVIPDNERWLHQPKTTTDLKNALSWAQANLPTDANVDILLEKLNGQD
jgi:putative transposon-encoded protein